MQPFKDETFESFCKRFKYTKIAKSRSDMERYFLAKAYYDESQERIAAVVQPVYSVEYVIEEQQKRNPISPAAYLAEPLRDIGEISWLSDTTKTLHADYIQALQEDLVERLTADRYLSHSDIGELVLHKMFYEQLTESTDTEPSPELADAISSLYGTVEETLSSLEGWLSKGDCFLVIYLNVLTGQLEIETSRYYYETSWLCVPLLVIDVQEHAYMNTYGADCQEYYRAVVEHLDWDVISGRYRNFAVDLVKTRGDNEYRVMKSNDAKQLVFGWANLALDAEGNYPLDWHGDIKDVETLETAAYTFVMFHRETGEQHQGESVGTLVESMMFTEEKFAALGMPDDILPQGWWLGFYLPDIEVYQKVKSGQYKMFSIEGTAVKEAI